MQAAFKSAPAEVTIRCYAELILAARKDMGLPMTNVTLLDLMGMRITDIHDSKYKEVFTLPEREVYRRAGWEPPWD
jgi:hypothetical protein